VAKSINILKNTGYLHQNKFLIKPTPSYIQDPPENNHFAFYGKNSSLDCVKNTKNNSLRSMDMNIYGK
jgi:hypothetical protein